MFERFTEKARRAISFARYEASTFGAPYIEPGHLLLAIFREDRPIFTNMLPVGISLTTIADHFRGTLQQRERIPTSVDLPLSEIVKRSLASAFEESSSAGQKHVTSAHMLVGLMREDATVTEFLKAYGITLENVRLASHREITAESTNTSGSATAVLTSLRQDFAPLVALLSPEIEPATVYRLEKAKADEG